MMNRGEQLIFQQTLNNLGSEDYWTKLVTGEPAPVSSDEPIRLAESRRPLIIEVLQGGGRTVFDLDRRELATVGIQTLGTAIGFTAGLLVAREVPGAVESIAGGISNGIGEIGNFVRGVPDLSLGEIANIPFYKAPRYLAQGLVKAVEIPLHCGRDVPTPTCGEITTVNNFVKTTISTGLAGLEEWKVGFGRRFLLPNAARGLKAVFTKKK